MSQTQKKKYFFNADKTLFFVPKFFSSDECQTFDKRTFDESYKKNRI